MGQELEQQGEQLQLNASNPQGHDKVRPSAILAWILGLLLFLGLFVWGLPALFLWFGPYLAPLLFIALFGVSLAVLLSVLWTLSWIVDPTRRAQKRTESAEQSQRLGRCLNCGYDLRATPDRCPECGTVPDQERHPKQ
jgi:hypothetical protein